MSHAVPALGAALLTASGSVWYLPALADLRAGADRPHSRRTAAAACLTGWSTIGALAVALFMAGGWRVPAAVAVTGAGVSAVLLVRAAVQRGLEARESARHWAVLRQAAPPTVAERGSRVRGVFATLVGCGLLAGTAAAALLAATGPAERRTWVTATAASAVLVALFLTVAVTWTTAARAVRRTAPPPPSRSPRTAPPSPPPGPARPTADGS
ncbi:hypothetical protein [Streptomyces dysideae]|uniref:hypothetical protein n=1 Tax=Streptomyces dysideae TaxID=909626 RepID=UPI00131A75AA|nr:hypothetical protein [Streptomyces dysideae]